MDYKELIEELRLLSGHVPEQMCDDNGKDPLERAADAIETLLAERDAAVEDLTRICEDNPDVCEYCKHIPCTDSHGRCIGWEWRGPQKGENHD